MKQTMQVSVDYSFQDLRNTFKGEALRTLDIIERDGMAKNFMISMPWAWASGAFSMFDMEYWLTTLRGVVLDFIRWAPEAYNIEDKPADTMPIYTTFNFADYLRTATGDAKQVLTLIAKAGQQEDFMDYMTWYWDVKPRTRKQIDAWITDTKDTIYREMNVFPV